jgi:general nucleoside transport system permease protein
VIDISWAVLLQLTLTKTTPLLLTASGGLLSERSGVINIALEGMMLAGAFGSIVGATQTGSPWVGLLAGGLLGAALGALHAVCSVYYGADQIVGGTAINLLAIGGTGFLLFTLFGTHGSSSSASKLDLLHVGSIGFYPTTILSILFLLLICLVLKRTTWGLWLRASGERPEALKAAGVSVERVRTVAVIAGGALAGIAGAHLALGDLSQFVERMTAGRGFIALAALIFGKWRPRGVLIACLFFGCAEAVADGFQGVGDAIPAQFFLAIPFILTMAVLAGFVGRSRPPAALGRPLEGET